MRHDQTRPGVFHLRQHNRVGIEMRRHFQQPSRHCDCNSHGVARARQFSSGSTTSPSLTTRLKRRAMRSATSRGPRLPNGLTRTSMRNEQSPADEPHGSSSQRPANSMAAWADSCLQVSRPSCHLPLRVDPTAILRRSASSGSETIQTGTFHLTGAVLVKIL